jgi:hypothetical protein
MYGSTPALDGVLLRCWTQPDGSAVSTLVLGDGRTYRVVGQVARSSKRFDLTELRQRSRRAVDDQVALVVAWDRSR